MLSHFSCVQFFVTLWITACQAPLFMGFTRQEYWSGLPYPPSGDLPNPGIILESLTSPALVGGFFTSNKGLYLESPLFVDCTHTVGAIIMYLNLTLLRVNSNCCLQRIKVFGVKLGFRVDPDSYISQKTPTLFRLMKHEPIHKLKYGSYSMIIPFLSHGQSILAEWQMLFCPPSLLPVFTAGMMIRPPHSISSL